MTTDKPTRRRTRRSAADRRQGDLMNMIAPAGSASAPGDASATGDAPAAAAPKAASKRPAKKRAAVGEVAAIPTKTKKKAPAAPKPAAKKRAKAKTDAGATAKATPKPAAKKRTKAKTDADATTKATPKPAAKKRAKPAAKKRAAADAKTESGSGPTKAKPKRSSTAKTRPAAKKSSAPRKSSTAASKPKKSAKKPAKRSPEQAVATAPVPDQPAAASLRIDGTEVKAVSRTTVRRRRSSARSAIDAPAAVASSEGKPAHSPPESASASPSPSEAPAASPSPASAKAPTQPPAIAPSGSAGRGRPINRRLVRQDGGSARAVIAAPGSATYGRPSGEPRTPTTVPSRPARPASPASPAAPAPPLRRAGRRSGRPIIAPAGSSSRRESDRSPAPESEAATQSVSSPATSAQTGKSIAADAALPPSSPSRKRRSQQQEASKAAAPPAKTNQAAVTDALVAAPASSANQAAVTAAVDAPANQAKPSAQASSDSAAEVSPASDNQVAPQTPAKKPQNRAAAQSRPAPQAPVARDEPAPAAASLSPVVPIAGSDIRTRRQRMAAGAQRGALDAPGALGLSSRTGDAIVLISRNHAEAIPGRIAAWRDVMPKAAGRVSLLDLGSTDGSWAAAEQARIPGTVVRGGLADPMATLEAAVLSADAERVLLVDLATPATELGADLLAALDDGADVALPAGRSPGLIALSTKAVLGHPLSDAMDIDAWVDTNGLQLALTGYSELPHPEACLVPRAMGWRGPSPLRRLARGAWRAALRRLPWG
ncbi:MAG: hypothetical protein KC502_21025 [Myxococcales bacterium]|nr:hypothetical protein [Myxococcales bacterium]